MEDVLLFIAGIVLVVSGAEWLINGSVAIAKRSGLSEYVIGATIVGIGTSMPELAVSFFAALRGNPDIAIGNVVGSNMANTCLILGITAVISPIVLTRQNMRRDIPITFFVSLLLAAFAMDVLLFGSEVNLISRPEAIVLLILFGIYMWLNFKMDQKSGTDLADAGDKETEKPAGQMSIAKAVMLILAGLTSLVIGGNFFVESGTRIALKLGVSESLIAIAMMAVGTSLPELATCVIAAVKKNNQLALGNILGSNVANILLILGVSGTLTPLSINAQSFLSAMLLPASIFLLWLASAPWSRKTLGRLGGTVMLAAYVIYILTIGKM